MTGHGEHLGLDREGMRNLPLLRKLFTPTQLAAKIQEILARPEPLKDSSSSTEAPT